MFFSHRTCGVVDPPAGWLRHHCRRIAANFYQVMGPDADLNFLAACILRCAPFFESATFRRWCGNATTREYSRRLPQQPTTTLELRFSLQRAKSATTLLRLLPTTQVDRIVSAAAAVPSWSAGASPIRLHSSISIFVVCPSPAADSREGRQQLCRS